jgi:predicted O-linked N-acetylglucosamine transferase (SPINDLY family)
MTITPQALLQDAMRLHRQGDLASAAQLYGKVLEATPADANALHLYGLVRHQQGAHAEGAAFIRRAVDLVPDQPVLRNNLGDALRMAGDPGAAVEQCQAALALRPGYAGAHINLCAAHGMLRNYDAALQHGREAVRLAPTAAQAHYNLAQALLDAMRLDQAADEFREVLRLDPDHPAAASNLLYLLNLIPGLDSHAVAAEHRQIGGRFDQVAKPGQAPAQREPKQPLRVGYVSRDLCAHAVSHFFEPVLAHHDRDRFVVHCYSDVEQRDAVSARLKSQTDHWRDVADWPDARLSEQVLVDGIDILVDLGGHTENNRLALFGQKPAPVQISWIGYPNTTGLATMDFRIVDTHTAPEAELGTEALLRLPQLFASFRPASHAPAVSPLPAISQGQVTFGSLHRLEKLNGSVIHLWSRLLQALPAARLLIARDELDPWQQRRIEQAFAAHGIDAGQLTLRRLDGARSFLEEFADIDVHLDSFPWSGHTIACSALWQGVPVVTLDGRQHAGRMVASVLRAVGLAHLVATDVDAYLRIAAELVSDLPALAAMRAGLRERLANSPLLDEQGFTRALEHCYLEAWASGRG